MQKDRIPDYVQEEIEKYKIEKANGNVSINTEESVMLFINLAKVNNRITEEEANELKEMVRNI